MRFIVLLAMAIGLIGFTGPAALAQIGDSSAPMDIEADHVDVFDAERRIVWTGNVHAVQGTSSIRADEIEVIYSGTGAGEGMSGGWGDIQRIVARQNVHYTTPTQTAVGDQGIYEIENETITLTGDVVIRQCDNVITTNRFITNLVTGDSSFGDQQQQGERVRAVLTQNNDGCEPAESE